MLAGNADRTILRRNRQFNSRRWAADATPHERASRGLSRHVWTTCGHRPWPGIDNAPGGGCPTMMTPKAAKRWGVVHIRIDGARFTRNTTPMPAIAALRRRRTWHIYAMWLNQRFKLDVRPTGREAVQCTAYNIPPPSPPAAIALCAVSRPSGMFCLAATRALAVLHGGQDLVPSPAG